MTQEVPAPEPAKKKTKKKEEVVTPLYTFTGTKQEQLQQIYNQWYGCRRCGLCDFRMLNNGEPLDDIVICSGTPDAAVMFIGEAPGAEETASGSCFVGNSGKLLNRILANTSDDPDIFHAYQFYLKQRPAPNSQRDDEFHNLIEAWRNTQYFFTNVVACQPPENRQPTGNEAKSCWERLWNLIYLVDPLVIVAVGKVALSTLIGRQVEITKIRGQLFDVEFPGRVGKLKYPVVPVLHPSYLLRKADWNDKSNGDYMKTVEDILKALRIADMLKNKYYGTPLPKRVSTE